MIPVRAPRLHKGSVEKTRKSKRTGKPLFNSVISQSWRERNTLRVRLHDGGKRTEADDLGEYVPDLTRSDGIQAVGNPPHFLARCCSLHVISAFAGVAGSRKDPLFAPLAKTRSIHASDGGLRVSIADYPSEILMSKGRYLKKMN